MASVNAVWGLDVGQCALKALRMRLAMDGSIEVTDFDVVEHPKILSQPDADADQLIRSALDKFLSRNDIGNARVALAVPGHSSFARFIKLPPVEPKRIPDIVRFEAAQQIPFDMDEVEWDYQTFISPASPDVEVGIFAMRKELVFRGLGNLTSQGIEAELVQLAPLALYNMMSFDEPGGREGASILIDVGAGNTDLVVMDGDRIWLRSIPLGGNNFTESLVKAFKLPFSKAESLKRTAATSKYARQIFVAMRPVFGDLLSEVQRSIGFYTSLHRDAQFKRLICLGNAFRLPGLQKYLEQNLQMEVVRLNTFNRLKPSATSNAPAFTENVPSFGVAYGLGAQALGQAPIRSNLLPFSIARQRNWKRQRWWFVAAAALMVAGVATSWWVTAGHARSLRADMEARASEPNGAFKRAEEVLVRNDGIQKEVGRLKGQGLAEIREIDALMRIIGYRDVVLQIAWALSQAMPHWEQEVRAKVAAATHKPEAELSWAKDVWPWLEKNRNQPPEDPNHVTIMQLRQLEMNYWEDLPPPLGAEGVAAFPAAAPGAPPPGAPFVAARGRGPVPPAEQRKPRGFRIRITGTVNLPDTEVATYLQRTYLERLVAQADDPAFQQRCPNIQLIAEGIRRAVQSTRSVAAAAGGAPAGATGRSGLVDPMGLPSAQDMEFNLAFDVWIRPPGSTERRP